MARVADARHHARRNVPQTEPLAGAIVDNQPPASWQNLLLRLSKATVVDGNRADQLYYALLPRNMPIGKTDDNRGIDGLTSSDLKVGAGLSDAVADVTMAHELGHVLGFTHAPCGLPPDAAADPHYPAYEPYDSRTRLATIGEYGLDTTRPYVYPPLIGRDFMSYCSEPWVSLYHYQKLLENPRLDPRWVSDPDAPNVGPAEFGPRDLPNPPPPWVGRRIPRTVEPDPVQLVSPGSSTVKQIDVRSVLRLETGPTAAGERIERTTVELLDDDGNVAEQRVPLRRIATYAGRGCGCSGEGDGEDRSRLVQALLPDPGRGTTLRVVRGEQELWSRRAPAQPLTLDDVSVESDTDQLRVSWSTSASDDYPTERFLRWSADDGRTWQTLAIDLLEDRAVIPLALMTSGKALLQVLVSDGFHTAMADPVRVEVPTRAPRSRS